MLKAKIQVVGKGAIKHYKIYIYDGDKVSDITIVEDIVLTDGKGIPIELEDVWK